MKIYKDKNYFKVYLTCVILDGILSVGVLLFIIFGIIHMVNIGFSASLLFLLLLLIAVMVLANILSWRSLLGYLKTPDVVFEINDNKVTMTPDRTKSIVEFELDNITNVELIRPVICRSGKRIVITTSNNTYFLEDIENLDKAYNDLVSVTNTK